jgi:predicted HicB family RNase H-like nuclease
MVARFGEVLGQETMYLRSMNRCWNLFHQQLRRRGHLMNKPAELLKATEELARSVESWADLSNALYDPVDGLLTRACATRAERETLVRTAEYQQIRELLEQARDRFGLVAGATPKKRGQLVIHLPLSLHAALEREAVSEGVSLDQLVVAKLTAPLKHLADAS